MMRRSTTFIMFGTPYCNVSGSMVTDGTIILLMLAWCMYRWNYFVLFFNGKIVIWQRHFILRMHQHNILYRGKRESYRHSSLGILRQKEYVFIWKLFCQVSKIFHWCHCKMSISMFFDCFAGDITSQEFYVSDTFYLCDGY